MNQRGHGNELSVAIKDLVVDLIAKYDEMMFLRNFCDGLERRARIYSARWIVRIDHHNGARARRDERFDFLWIGFERVLAAARVMHRATAIQIDRCCPKRI